MDDATQTEIKRLEDTMKEAEDLRRTLDGIDIVGYDDLIRIVDTNLRRMDRNITYGLAFIAGVLIANQLRKTVR